MLSCSRTVRLRPWLPALGFALAPAILEAQAPADGSPARPASADSALRSAGLAGTVAAQLDAFIGRYDPSTTAYGVSVQALPFVTNHVQFGVGTGYNGYKVTGSDALHSSGLALMGNYVVGDGPRWRGYAGGYAGQTDVSGAPRQNTAGVQIGALYFLDPAVALQAEYQYGRVLFDSRPAFGRLVVTLQPYLFGRAGSTTPAPAGLGMADVAFTAFDWGRDGGTRGASGHFAPFLTRWLQVGGEAAANRYASVYAGNAGVFTSSLTTWSGTAFARAYLPLGVRAQPFAGGFVQHATTALRDSRFGLTSYGPALGVRYFLSARVAVDGTLQRQFYGDYTGSALGGDGPATHTAFTIGLATRFGRTR